MLPDNLIHYDPSGQGNLILDHSTTLGRFLNKGPDQRQGNGMGGVGLRLVC